MNWPRELRVFIESEENETKSKFLRSVPFALSGEYETESGDRFCIDIEYLKECQEKHVYPRIPAEVIRLNAESREKLETAQKFLNKQEKEKQTGLILPPC